MGIHAGAHLIRVRVQPALAHHGVPSVSARSLHLVANGSRVHTNLCIASWRLSHSSNLSWTQRCAVSTSSASTSSKPASIGSDPDPLSDPLNPPASTRPPPLDLPPRDPATNLFTHLFRLGKAYTTFYKAGLKAVFTNRRLLRHLPDTPPPKFPSPEGPVRGTPSAATVAATAPVIPGLALSRSLDKSANPTRSALLLRTRVRHDTARLPLFALIVLICGEFTPLIVLLFPRLTPYTCRIPSQTAVIRRSVESRRAASFRSLAHVNRNDADSAAFSQVADGHICRSLGLGSALWDRAGFDVPFARSRAADVVARIVQDDALLRVGGGVSRLIDDEVVLACEERGMPTLDKDPASLRDQLADWVVKSAPSQTDDAEAAMNEASDKVRMLLLGIDESL